MTRSRRTLLFFGIVTLFFVIAPAVILYSQGYRFDLKTRNVTQVGAFYFNVDPPRATIAVDGEIIGTTTRFGGTALTKNFIPRIYNVQISKDGHHTWEKNLEIHPKQVTDAKHILLFPADLKFRILKDEVISFWMAPNNSYTVLQKRAPQGTWLLTLWDLNKNIEYPIFQPEKLQDTLWKIQWSPDSRKFLLQVGSQERIVSFIQEIDFGLFAQFPIQDASMRVASETRFLLDFVPKEILELQFDPSHAQQIILLSPSEDSSNLSLANYRLSTLLQPFAFRVLTFTVQGNRILWLDTSGRLHQQNSSEQTSIILSEFAHPVRKETAYEIFGAGTNIFLKDQETLYRFHTDLKKFDRISNSAGTVVTSPDETKIALTNGSEILIYFLEDQSEQPKHRNGEQAFLTRFSKEVKNLIWFNSHYLLFSVASDIKVSEIDNRNHINIVDLGDFSKPQLFWEPNSTTLHILSDAKLYVSEKLF